MDLHALYDPARNPIDGLVSKLERGRAAAAFEVLYDPVANRLVLLSRAIRVRVKPREELIEGLLIEIPLADLNIPRTKAD